MLILGKKKIFSFSERSFDRTCQQTRDPKQQLQRVQPARSPRATPPSGWEAVSQELLQVRRIHSESITPLFLGSDVIVAHSHEW